MLAHLSAIELTAYRAALHTMGSADDLPLLDSIRLENFRRPKNDRGFLNNALIQLAQVPEYDKRPNYLMKWCRSTRRPTHVGQNSWGKRTKGT